MPHLSDEEATQRAYQALETWAGKTPVAREVVCPNGRRIDAVVCYPGGWVAVEVKASLNDLKKELADPEKSMWAEEQAAGFNIVFAETINEKSVELDAFPETWTVFHVQRGVLKPGALLARGWAPSPEFAQAVVEALAKQSTKSNTQEELNAARAKGYADGVARSCDKLEGLLKTLKREAK